jgi:hypothetical protein
MEEQSDSPDPLWYPLNIAQKERLETEGRGEMSEDAASFYGY